MDPGLSKIFCVYLWAKVLNAVSGACIWGQLLLAVSIPEPEGWSRVWSSEPPSVMKLRAIPKQKVEQQNQRHLLTQAAQLHSGQNWGQEMNCEVLVVHTCNPSYSGGRDQEDGGSKKLHHKTRLVSGSSYGLWYWEKTPMLQKKKRKDTR
jgi:hypothetical protein